MRMEIYEAMLDENEIDREIAQAEAECCAGGTSIDAREALNALRKKYLRGNKTDKESQSVNPVSCFLAKDRLKSFPPRD